MSASSPLAYVVLGTPGSGRRALLRDLIEHGLAPEEKTTVLVAESETTDPAETELAALPNVSVRRWRWQAPGFPERVADEAGNIFLVADPLVPVVDQLEALKPWLDEQGLRIGRVLTVVDCGLAEKMPALQAWFDACIHFSDVVLLTRREGVANKWLSDFLAGYRDQFFPCHFIPVKKKGLENPALILDPTPRRVSQYFDEMDDLPEVGIESADEESDEDDEDAPVEDPYLERMRGGRRVKEVPDLRDHLAACRK